MEIPDRLREELRAVRRNDPDRAEGVARAIAHEVGSVPGQTMMYLWMLQDDPADFARRVADVPVTPDGAR